MKYKQNVFVVLIFISSICLTKFPYVVSQCNDVQWECDNGQCIDIDNKCNGQIDCNDSSDEIAENCMKFYETCQSYAFQCRYGACISKTLRCDGHQDCADNSDELICSVTNEASLRGQCSEEEMQCVTTKECIGSNSICDGRRDCSDGSDETVELCIGYGCIKVGFQCGYGACINGYAKCNGTSECADGSDEAWELCNYPRKKNNRGTITPTRTPTPSPIAPPIQTIIPTTSQQCQIPNTKQTQKLVFKLHPSNVTVTPGTFVEEFHIIHLECKNSFVLSVGESDLICRNGEWKKEFPSCPNYCDRSLLEGLSTRAICDFEQCKKNIPPNTEIQISCARGYTTTERRYQHLMCLPGGTFDKKRETCKQNCGKVLSSSEILTTRGIPIKPSNAPWHVAIYEYTSIDYLYICSGSIISPRIIISAAHCFWDIANSVTKNNKFQVIAGKNTRNYTTSDDEFPQIMDAKQILTPEGYAGKESDFRDDIAIVKLEFALMYNENISAICISSLFRNTAQNYIPSGKKGFVTGYGLHNQLERVQMSTINYHNCSEHSPVDTRLADDKFCIKNNDGSSVCRGDSGGGFVIVTSDVLNGNIYYLLGVISNTPNTQNDCTRNDDDAYVAVTNMRLITRDFEDIIRDSLKEDAGLF